MAKFYRHTTQNVKARVGVTVPPSLGVLIGTARMPLTHPPSGHPSSNSAHLPALRRANAVTSGEQALNQQQEVTSLQRCQTEHWLTFPKQSVTWTAPDGTYRVSGTPASTGKPAVREHCEWGRRPAEAQGWGGRGLSGLGSSL